MNCKPMTQRLENDTNLIAADVIHDPQNIKFHHIVAS